MKILNTKQVCAPGESTHLSLHIIDRGKGRECIHTCYINDVLEQYIDKGLITVNPIPANISDDELAYHPEIWAAKKSA
jgi:hypothetical protein